MITGRQHHNGGRRLLARLWETTTRTFQSGRAWSLRSAITRPAQGLQKSARENEISSAAGAGRQWYPALAVSTLVHVGAIVLLAFPAYKRHRAIQEIKRVGGTVEMETVGPQWLSQWGIGFERVKTVYLQGSGISDDKLKHLSGLTTLETLYLNDTKITDDGLKHLSGLTNLRELWLFDTEITDDGLKHLSSLTNL